MRNYAKFSIIMALAILSACRSHKVKVIEESAWTSSDSCTVESTIRIQSLKNIAAAESSDSSFHQDHFDFEEGAGMIQIHPDGEVTIKGLKSASLIRKSNRKTSNIQISESDTLSSESYSESYSATTSEVKPKSETPISTPRWIKLLFLVGAIILVICIKYAVHCVKMRNELRKM